MDLGMIDGVIADTQITASSWHPTYPPYAVRPSDHGWCADPNEKSHYVSVNVV
jgi:hypothetical protein